jgi:hypothetical protein
MLATKTKVPDPVLTCQKLQQAERRCPEQLGIRRSLVSVFAHAQKVFQAQATRPDVRWKMLWSGSQREWTQGGRKTMAQVWV